MSQIAQTEQQLLQIVHSLYEGNTSYPATTDDDYLVRRDLANKAIMSWDMVKGVLWNELWVPSAGAPGAALTIVANTTQYALPTDFRFIADFVRLIDSNGAPTYYKKINPQDSDLYVNKMGQVFWITGNAKTGYFLNFPAGTTANPFPTSAQIGNTIQYDYYKRPTLLASSTDVPEMSNPDYIINYVLSYLYRQDDNYDGSDREAANAKDVLQSMKTVNMEATWREDNSTKDGLFDDQQVPGFGI